MFKIIIFLLCCLNFYLLLKRHFINTTTLFLLQVLQKCSFEYFKSKEKSLLCADIYFLQWKKRHAKFETRRTSVKESMQIKVWDYTLQIVCIFFVCEEANKTLNYLRLIANKANKIQRPIKIKIKASIKVPSALKRHFC